MKSNTLHRLLAFVVLAIACQATAWGGDPLPSWRDGESKQAIMRFVDAVSNKDGPDYVASEARIAVFDNDGTLWAEKPFYFQLAFALRADHYINLDGLNVSPRVAVIWTPIRGQVLGAGAGRKRKMSPRWATNGAAVQTP